MAPELDTTKEEFDALLRDDPDAADAAAEIRRLGSKPGVLEAVLAHVDDEETLVSPALQKSLRAVEAGELIDITPDDQFASYISSGIRRAPIGCCLEFYQRFYIQNFLPNQGQRKEYKGQLPSKEAVEFGSVNPYSKLCQKPFLEGYLRALQLFDGQNAATNHKHLDVVKDYRQNNKLPIQPERRGIKEKDDERMNSDNYRIQKLGHNKILSCFADWSHGFGHRLKTDENEQTKG